MSESGFYDVPTSRRDSVYFIDGCSPRDNLLGLIAFPHRLKGMEREFTRFYIMDSDHWQARDFEFDSRSIIYSNDGDDVTWIILGKRGEVLELSGAGMSMTHIDGAGTGPGNHGYVNRIRCVGSNLVACGFGRQVHKLTGRSWSNISAGIMAPDGETRFSFESVDGFSLDELYCAGSCGEIFQYDGRSWIQHSLPTNLDLQEIRRIGNQMYAVGDGGAVLSGRGSTWKILDAEDVDIEFWGVDEFRGQVFCAGYGGIAVVDGDLIDWVDLELTHRVDGYRLCRSQNLLWSVGNDALVRFDGNQWRVVVCPDNA